MKIRELARLARAEESDRAARLAARRAATAADDCKFTTCYMCACRCGIKVHLRDNAIRYIEGNRDHPVNRGKICAKGAAGIMQQSSPARLSKPLLRTGERGKEAI